MLRQDLNRGFLGALDHSLRQNVHLRLLFDKLSCHLLEIALILGLGVLNFSIDILDALLKVGVGRQLGRYGDIVSLDGGFDALHALLDIHGLGAKGTHVLILDGAGA